MIASKKHKRNSKGVAPLTSRVYFSLYAYKRWEEAVKEVLYNSQHIVEQFSLRQSNGKIQNNHIYNISNNSKLPIRMANTDARLAERLIIIYLGCSCCCCIVCVCECMCECVCLTSRQFTLTECWLFGFIMPIKCSQRAQLMMLIAFRWPATTATTTYTYLKVVLTILSSVQRPPLAAPLLRVN